MAKQITYLFGAGASYNAIPVVKDIRCSMKGELDSIEKRLAAIANDDSIRGSKPNVNKYVIDQFISDYNWILDETRKHQSIDTLAKKLFLQRKISSELKKLKTILTIYFHLIQGGKRADQRYDSFIASILTEPGNVYKLPSNLKVLSWNYDYQFEKAYSEYLNDYTFEKCNEYLNINSKNSDSFLKSKAGFGIIKLNGTASFMLNKETDRQYNYIPNTNGEIDDDTLCTFLQDYENLIHNETAKFDFIPSLSFAWESDNNTNSIVDKAIEFTKDTEILVVIGYSFPVFNRGVDKKIIQSMKHLDKVYFQAPDALDLKERFLTINDKLEEKQLVTKTDVNQFIFPNEFEF